MPAHVIAIRQAELKRVYKQAIRSVKMENVPAVQNRSFGITPKGIEEAIRLAKIMASSGLMPKCIESPEAVFVAMQMGAELGLSPMASVQNIAVINGRPGIYGDAALAVVRASGLLEEFKEWSEGDRKKPNWTFYCRIKRKGSDAAVGSYSWAEALEAGYDQVKPESPWKKWTNRMMQFKARNFVMRDQFTDYLKGIRTIEENIDAIEFEATMDGDGNEQYQARNMGRSEMSGDGTIDGNAFDLLAAENYPDGLEGLNDFVIQTAEVNKVSVDDLKVRAAANWDDFIKAFEAWNVKNGVEKNGNVKTAPESQEAKTPPPIPATTTAPPTRQPPPTDAEVWADFRTRYINLKGAGYSTFVYQNLETFRHSPKNLQMEAVEKWVKLYPTQSWPLSGPQSATPPPISESVAPPVPQERSPENSASSSMPMSFSPEYKNMMARKNEFPAEYRAAMDEHGVVPTTRAECVTILNRMMEIVEAQIEKSQESYVAPGKTDTSGFG